MASATIAQSLPLLLWFKSVNDTVSEPYLDEEFHVHQAQTYCQGRWTIWDPKITTPPGLYLISSALAPVFGCDLTVLRGIGLLCLSALLGTVVWTFTNRENKKHGNLGNAQHSAFNVTLFPPLFFFSALYYTDVPSTLSVLLFYAYFLYSHQHGTSVWLHNTALTIFGVITLTFRQTNIFWVAVFPAGIVVVKGLDKGHEVVKSSMYRRIDGFGDSLSSVARTSWKLEVVYQPSVREASIDDYIKTLVSIATCGLKASTQPKRLIDLALALAPFLAILGSFAAFVLWNGGVVLGDKSNHNTTLHLPQMLYIWPYFAFFSWPVIYPYLITFPFGLLAKLQQFAPLEAMLIFKRRGLLPRLWLVATFTGLACAVVRFNTIVHPFTLADNRHYTFYVFRLLMQTWWVKYAVTPIYILCGWACIQALGARPPFPITDMVVEKRNTRLPNQSSKSKATDKGMGDEQPATEIEKSSTRALTLPTGDTSATTAFVLVWLATTSLQLITAPLVEPRYLILPWIFWRIHLPLQMYTPAATAPTTRRNHRFVGVDHRLWLETAWFLLVNAVTGYIFLQWEFAWPQEPGKVQRFMW